MECIMQMNGMYNVWNDVRNPLYISRLRQNIPETVLMKNVLLIYKFSLPYQHCVICTSVEMNGPVTVGSHNMYNR